ncbi:SDR family oxidoreductase [Candidatus Nomurabacteria bacterium]|nr:SDR family oxidoreductase [Candidatus Nomurabacteria bacterium]
MELKDKVVVITGGSRGFGKALAEAFLNEGAKVAICSLNEEEVRKTATETGALGVCGDVTKEEEMKTLAEKTKTKFGKIDVWVNNAGLWMTGLAEDVDMEKVRKMFEVNVIGLINGSRVALRHMKEKNSGVIINISSRASLSGRPLISEYAASKWAVNGFTKSIREENKDTNILILSVMPGGMKTTIFGADKPENFDNFMDVKDVAKKVIQNLKLENPELDSLIERSKL